MRLQPKPNEDKRLTFIKLVRYEIILEIRNFQRMRKDEIFRLFDIKPLYFDEVKSM